MCSAPKGSGLTNVSEESTRFRTYSLSAAVVSKNARLTIHTIYCVKPLTQSLYECSENQHGMSTYRWVGPSGPRVYNADSNSARKDRNRLSSLFSECAPLAAADRDFFRDRHPWD